MSESSAADESWRVVRIAVSQAVLDGSLELTALKRVALDRYDVDLHLSRPGTRHEWRALEAQWPGAENGGDHPPRLVVRDTTLEEVQALLPMIHASLAATNEQAEKLRQEEDRARAEENWVLDQQLAKRRALLDQLNEGLA